MKRIALSLLVLATSGAYVWTQSGKPPADDLLGSPLPAAGTDTVAVRPEPASLIERESPGSRVTIRYTGAGFGAPADSEPMRVVTVPVEPEQPAAAAPSAPADPGSVASADIPLPAPAVRAPLPHVRPAKHSAQARVVPAATIVAAKSSGYADGTYTGPVADAYYGEIQIQAIVKGGRLVAIKVLRYPSDRRTSIAINRQALPMLRNEVIAAQSASVDIVSGATLTSEAFILSLGAALHQAAS